MLNSYPRKESSDLFTKAFFTYTQNLFFFLKSFLVLITVLILYINYENAPFLSLSPYPLKKNLSKVSFDGSIF